MGTTVRDRIRERNIRTLGVLLRYFMYESNKGEMVTSLTRLDSESMNGSQYVDRPSPQA